MERREGNRKGTRAVLVVRMNDHASPTQLFDLSPTGCRIDRSEWHAARDDGLVVEFSEEINVSGRIAWRRGNTAGVQFDEPLPETIARHLRF